MNITDITAFVVVMSRQCNGFYTSDESDVNCGLCQGGGDSDYQEDWDWVMFGDYLKKFSNIDVMTKI